MLPIQIEKRFNHPAAIENAFLAWLKANNAEIGQSKTIATNVLYHAKDISNLTTSTFFSGTFIASDTNIVGAFIRPQSEHLCVYGIRAYTGSQLGTVTNQSWHRGLDFSLDSIPYNATISIINNSERELKNLPMTEFDADLTTKDQGTVFLDQPILWEGQTELQLVLDAANGTAFASGQFMRFDLVGLGLI